MKYQLLNVALDQSVKTFLNGLLWASIITIVLCLFLYLLGEVGMLQSRLIKSAERISCDMLYYLPVAELTLKATLIAIEKKTGTVAEIIPTEIRFESTVHIAADTSACCMVNYMPSRFANDELKITVGTDGLLQSVSATAESQISNIISIITEAPGKMTGAAGTPSRMQSTADITITECTYTHDFTFSQSELKSGKAERHWTINTVPDGAMVEQEVDASFSISFNNSDSIKAAADDIPVYGLFTRRLKELSVDINIPKIAFATNMQLTIQVPDTSSLVVVPVKRSNFVKKINTPKFTNGLLTENTINKPSELEGLYPYLLVLGKPSCQCRASCSHSQ